MVQAVRDGTGTTGQTAADLAVEAGRPRAMDSARSDRAVQGYGPASVNPMTKEDVRGAVPEHRAACVFSLLKPELDFVHFKGWVALGAQGR